MQELYVNSLYNPSPDLLEVPLMRKGLLLYLWVP